MTEYFYKSAPPRWQERMENAAPPCDRNAPGAAKLKDEIVALDAQMKELAQKTRSLRIQLEKICKHPTKKRMIDSFSIFDTRGCIDGSRENCFCTVCGKCLHSEVR